MVNSKESRIKVIGLGEVGGKAVAYLYERPHKYVSVVASDVDYATLSGCLVPDKLILNKFAKDDPGIYDDITLGKTAATESINEVKALLAERTDILFVVTDISDSTGSGAATVFTQAARELDILTIVIGILPYRAEETQNYMDTEKVLQDIKAHSDAQLILSPDRLLESSDQHTAEDASTEVHKLIFTTVRCIADIVTIEAEVNVDLEDVRTVIAGASKATVGSGVGVGEGRAMLAAHGAVATALLGNEIKDANRVLLSVISGPETELEMDELIDIVEFIQNSTSEQAEIIFGHAIDDDLKDQLRVTFITSTFSEN